MNVEVAVDDLLLSQKGTGIHTLVQKHNAYPSDFVTSQDSGSHRGH